MTAKKLKYQQYLEKFPNCPSSDFKEVERDGYRWTSNPLTAKDFIPVNLIKEPPPRMLDDSDKMCMAYGLSMFDTLSNSISKYQKLYNNFRLHQKEQFKQDKGSYIALIKLTERDGVADKPNNFGHFTFHAYSDTSLEAQVLSFCTIFNGDGEFNR